MRPGVGDLVISLICLILACIALSGQDGKGVTFGYVGQEVNDKLNAEYYLGLTKALVKQVIASKGTVPAGTEKTMSYADLYDQSKNDILCTNRKDRAKALKQSAESCQGFIALSFIFSFVGVVVGTLRLIKKMPETSCGCCSSAGRAANFTVQAGILVCSVIAIVCATLMWVYMLSIVGCYSVSSIDYKIGPGTGIVPLIFQALLSSIGLCISCCCEIPTCEEGTDGVPPAVAVVAVPVGDVGGVATMGTTAAPPPPAPVPPPAAPAAPPPPAETKE